ncbi:MAG: DMT family transporter [Candidatus Pacebacteria bacterium]|nr:DMT family transporter [Candidatus Paceibacterota bacterium]
MQWFFIALAAPFLWALVNVADKYLVTRFSHKEEERSSGGLVLFSSLIGIVISFLIWIFVPDVFNIPILDKFLLFICGILTIIWIVFYLFALEIEEISNVVPWFLSVPIFGYILGFFFLGEKLTFSQFIGSGIIFLGLILISLDFSKEKKSFKHKPVFYMLFACIAVAISGVIFKYVTVGNNFWISSFWEYLGLGVSGLFIFLFIPHYRKSFLHMNRTGGYTIFIVNTVSEFMSIIGNLLTSYALLLAPVAMVFLVGSFQPAIVLFLTIFTTKFFPEITKENLEKRMLLPKMVAIAIMIIGSVILFL